MSKRLVALSLLLSLAAGAAIAADGQHYATAPTQKAAKRLATEQARVTAKALAQCYHPARQVNECVAVDSGFRCRAETSARYSSCKRAGWVNEYKITDYDRWKYANWRSPAYTPWLTESYARPVTPSAYGASLPRDTGPLAPPPFPNNN